MPPDHTTSCCSDGADTISIGQITSSSGLCPQSGSRGSRVDGATVKAMIAVSLTEVRNTQYFFCKDADCPVVYFSDDGTQMFTKDQLRERVYQKEPDSGEVFICYCFRHTPASIRAEFVSTGASSVVETVNAGIQAGQCACDIRNPQGSCCLGNVSVFVKELQQIPHQDDTKEGERYGTGRTDPYSQAATNRLRRGIDAALASNSATSGRR